MHMLLHLGPCHTSYALSLFNLLLPLLGFDEGSPDGHDPLQIARQMASRGITLVS